MHGRSFAADTALVDAAERKDFPAVRILLDKGADVNVVQVDGMTALHWAAYWDATETARLLIGAGANVQAMNRYEVTPLSLACENGNANVVEMLLDAGADPKTTLPGGETVLMTSSRTGRIAPVRALLARGDSVNAVNKDGQTALMWAAAEGHANVVRALLTAGADYRTTLKSGFTPLFFAVREGRKEVVHVLLDAGANVQAVMQPQKRTGKGPRPGTSALMLAVENGHFELAIALVKSGADPNDQRSGFTALHAISWVRKPNSGDGPDGDPAPTGSGSLNSEQCVRQLVARGADVNSRLQRGSSGRGRLAMTGATPFLLAADTADVPLMKLLVELGADPSIPNVDGCTPLMAAAGIGTLAPTEEAGTEPEAIAAVRLTLKLGGDINAIDKNGETAMHGAAYKSLPKMVRFLADKGAEPSVWNRKNKYGWTPLMIAEGYRPGNFKPSAETIEAFHDVMRAAGITPPTPTPRTDCHEDDPSAEP